MYGLLVHSISRRYSYQTIHAQLRVDWFWYNASAQMVGIKARKCQLLTGVDGMVEAVCFTIHFAAHSKSNWCKALL